MSLAIVLVEPERPANVGAAARAMRNFGLSELRLVGGRHCLPGGTGHAEARAVAWGAAEVLEAARSHATLAEAVADLHLVAATSGREEQGCLDPRAFAARCAGLPEGTRAGCVFGPEDHGLTNVQLDASRLRVRIPSSDLQPSLNLGQAVVIVAYEQAMARASREPARATTAEPPALEADVERLWASARELGLRAGYLNPAAPEHVLGELRRLLARADPTAREVVLLQGLVAQLRWAVEQASASGR